MGGERYIFSCAVTSICANMGNCGSSQATKSQQPTTLPATLLADGGQKERGNHECVHKDGVVDMQSKSENGPVPPPEIAAELAKIDAANAAKDVKMQALQEADEEAFADGATEVRSESRPTYCTPGEHA